MTIVEITGGICGFTTRVTAQSNAADKGSHELESENPN